MVLATANLRAKSTRGRPELLVLVLAQYLLEDSDGLRDQMMAARWSHDCSCTMKESKKLPEAIGLECLWRLRIHVTCRQHVVFVCSIGEKLFRPSHYTFHLFLKGYSFLSFFVVRLLLFNIKRLCNSIDTNLRTCEQSPKAHSQWYLLLMQMAKYRPFFLSAIG